MRRLTRLAAALLFVLPAAGCGDAEPSESPRATASPRPGGPVTLRVPAEEPTIGAAVDEARPGDLVLVSPGTYREAVVLDVPGITLRGTDRNAVVVDGELTRHNGIVVSAPGVAVQNLTVREHLQNGVLVTGMVREDGEYGHAHGGSHGTGYQRLDPEEFPPLQGFRVDHVTAVNNGLYGLYAFDAQHGVIEDSYASGSADSGIYVGQCQPCDVVVRRNVMERNAVGFEDANAGGALYVVGNRMVGNRVGATLTSDHQEAFVPQRDAVFAGNLVADNAEAATPSQADGGFGLGVGIAGGTRNQVLRNRIAGNPAAGLLLSSSDDLPPLDNRVAGNVFAGNRTDVVYAASDRAPGRGNCLADNRLRSTLPQALLTTPCAEGAAAPGATMPDFAAPSGIAFSEVADPPAQPGLADAATLPAVDASRAPAVDVDEYDVPRADFLEKLSAYR